MKFGIVSLPTDQSIEPASLARACEERGFDSLFYGEHTHTPTSRKTPFVVGGKMPESYWHNHDQFVALSYAAAVTQKLKIGTAVSLVTEHDPINLAKRVASLDRLSGGRFLFGIGAGWNVEEMADHGVSFEDRWRVTRERILAMKAIWTEDEPEFHGAFVDFEPMWSWPKPLQEGGPPILMGASSRFTPARIAEYCDGWMPLDGYTDIEGGLDAVAREMRQRGRDPASLDVTVGMGTRPDADVPDEDRLRKLIDLGVTRIAFLPPAAPAAQILPELDRYAELAVKFD